MRMFRRMLAASLLAGVTLLPAAASAQPPIPPIPGCEGGQLPSGAFSLICVPPPGIWNGELVVFAHGYVPVNPLLPVNQQLIFANLQLPDGTPLPQLVMGLGYAFATTTYRQNGLAILEGVDDIRELVGAFPLLVPTHVAGVSEGGLVATLLAERWPELFRSAVAACAPIGSFRAQIDSFGDFRVLFDYFFPGVILGSPILIPDTVIENWEKVYVPRILEALAANPARALELMRVSRAAFDPADPTTVGRTTINMLSYNVLGANDATAKLGGNPFGNRFRLYFGSSNDLRLNLSVQRFTASPAARAALDQYETNGNLSLPLVTLHTTGDEVIPFWHELLYLPKVDLTGRGRFLPIPTVRYGHCNFTANEVLTAFALAVRQL
jgi:pimeloyl-ACP methyl ester carboxylesterase